MPGDDGGNGHHPVALFNPGKIHAMPGAIEAMEAAGQDPAEFLDRHVTGDWGDVDEHDAQENDFSVSRNPLRVLVAGYGYCRPT